MEAEVGVVKKDGLIYFNPYWQVDDGTYMNTYPGCDAIIEDVDRNLIRVYVCASSVDANGALVRLRRCDSRYSKYSFWNNSSAYEMGDIVSLFPIEL